MEIDKRILKDSMFIKSLSLSELRLIKDGDVDWFVLIPRVENAIEFLDLNAKQQLELINEINYVSNALRKYSKPNKINIGALGNMVPQLHIHIIARYSNDRAWPGAIWGTKSKKNFQNYMGEAWIKRMS